jgi:hypothetical protein
MTHTSHNNNQNQQRQDQVSRKPRLVHRRRRRFRFQAVGRLLAIASAANTAWSRGCGSSGVTWDLLVV